MPGSIGTDPVTGKTYFEQPQTIHIDRYRGRQVERHYDGRADALLADLDALATDIDGTASQGTDYAAVGARAMVTARFGTVTPTATFSLRTEEVSQSLWKHPGLSMIWPDLVKLVVDLVDDRVSRSEAISQMNAKAAELGDRTVNGLFYTAGNLALRSSQAYDLILAGDENYLVEQSYSLTMTRVFAFTYPHGLQLSLANDGKIFTSNGLAAYTGTNVPFLVPQLNVNTSTETLQLIFGWRKRGSELHDLPDGNVQLDESWQSARWSLLLYNLAT